MSEISPHSVAPAAGHAARRVALTLGWQDSAESDVVLLTARAGLHLLAVDLGDDLQVPATLERLHDLAIRKADGSVGWGLTSAWDSFNKGVINPADTIYSYTTSAAGLAFCDAYLALGERRYLDIAAAAAETLLTATCCWRSGDLLSVWYSDQAADQLPEYQTHNVSALTLGLLSRIDRHLPAPRFSAARQALAAHLLREQGRDLGDRPSIEGTAPVAASNWRYRQGDSRPNDLFHECFIVEGLLEAGVPACREAALLSLAGIWETHFSGTGDIKSGGYTWGSLGWGPAAALFVLASAPEFAVQSQTLALRLVQLVDEPGFPEQTPISHPRAIAWYALALARYAVRTVGVSRLLPPVPGASLRPSHVRATQRPG